jgi:hypothetical protein
MFLDKEGNVITGKVQKAIGHRNSRIAGVLQFIKLGSLPMKN